MTERLLLLLYHLILKIIQVVLMTHQNSKVATIEIIPTTGFKFEGKIIYWNESRESVRGKIGLIYKETENPYIDEYDEIVFNEHSDGYLLYFEYDNNDNLKKIYSPVGFKIIYNKVSLHYCEEILTIRNKLNSINIFEKTLKEYHLIYEELNLVIGTAKNEAMFEFMFLYRDFKDVRSCLDLSFSKVKIIDFQLNKNN